MPNGKAPQYDTFVPTLPRKSINSQVAGNVAMRKKTVPKISALITGTSSTTHRHFDARPRRSSLLSEFSNDARPQLLGLDHRVDRADVDGAVDAVDAIELGGDLAELLG